MPALLVSGGGPKRQMEGNSRLELAMVSQFGRAKVTSMLLPNGASSSGA